jgi:uncharacterized protein (TIGR02271 family)
MENREEQSFNNEEKASTSSTVLPIVEEKVEITKKVIDKAKVRLSKVVSEHTETFNLPISEDEITVTRVPRNVIVDSAPEGVRYEGNVMIIPVLKEVAVVEKRILLVEEIHVVKNINQKIETKEVVLREEKLQVERAEMITKKNSN